MLDLVEGVLLEFATAAQLITRQLKADCFRSGLRIKAYRADSTKAAELDHKQRRVLEGKCWSCNNPKRPGMKTCAACAKVKLRSFKRKQRKKKIPAWRKAYRDNKPDGICKECPRPAKPGRKTCQTCIDKSVNRRRERKAA